MEEDCLKRRESIKLTNTLELDGCSKIIVAGGGASALAQETFLETVSNRTYGATQIEFSDVLSSTRK